MPSNILKQVDVHKIQEGSIVLVATALITHDQNRLSIHKTSRLSLDLDNLHIQKKM